MKKFFTLAAMALAFSTAVHAQNFTTLTTPEEILANSLENEAGAKTAFEAVLDNAEATDAEKADAMHLYMQLSTPAPGYAYDMSFLLSYNAVTAENKGQYTKAKLAEVWHSDVEGVVPSADNNTLQVDSDADNGTFMRIYSAAAFKAETSFDKFLVYESVKLTSGKYKLTAKAYTKGAVNCVTLSAGDTNSSQSITRSPMQDCAVDFSVTGETEQEVKLGFKRNSTAGSLTHLCFNDMYLYKVSNIVEITDASGAPTAATNVDVILNREFEAGVYYPICLPFVVENWRDVFADLLLWINYADGLNEFKTVAGANTQARKPYMVKFNDAVTANNYMRFNGVDIQAGNAGSWIKTVAEGEPAFPVKMVGNWAAMELPEKCYMFDGSKWVLASSDLSRSGSSMESFSAYIDASGLETAPELMGMKINDEVVTVLEVAEAADAPAIVNVYNLQGMVVKAGVSEADALEGLPRGLYIVNGKKVVK